MKRRGLKIKRKKMLAWILKMLKWQVKMISVNKFSINKKLIKEIRFINKDQKLKTKTKRWTWTMAPVETEVQVFFFTPEIKWRPKRNTNLRILKLSKF